ncbi:hypothetical protein ACWHLZ_37160 [Streptomyces chartreusis]
MRKPPARPRSHQAADRITAGIIGHHEGDGHARADRFAPYLEAAAYRHRY